MSRSGTIVAIDAIDVAVWSRDAFWQSKVRETRFCYVYNVWQSPLGKAEHPIISSLEAHPDTTKQPRGAKNPNQDTTDLAGLLLSCIKKTAFEETW